MALHPSGMELLNQFALVVYIPDPLGKFLDDLRRSLVPGCKPHAHVSVLPPRPLSAPALLASEQVRDISRDFSPFNIALGSVEIFPLTGVIYLEVQAGAGHLENMHGALNGGALGHEEPFTYHPHVTLAQDFDPGDLARLKAQADEKWLKFRGPRKFRAETLTFVRNTGCNAWIDLAQVSLGAVTVG